MAAFFDLIGALLYQIPRSARNSPEKLSAKGIKID